MAQQPVPHPGFPALPAQGGLFPPPPPSINANSVITLDQVEAARKYSEFLEDSSGHAGTRRAARKRHMDLGAIYDAQVVEGYGGGHVTAQQLNQQLNQQTQLLTTIMDIHARNATTRIYNKAANRGVALEWVETNQGMTPAQPCPSIDAILTTISTQQINNWLQFYSLSLTGNDLDRRHRMLRHLGA